MTSVNAVAALRQMDARTISWDQWIIRATSPEYLLIGLLQETAAELIRYKLLNDRALSGVTGFPFKNARAGFDVSNLTLLWFSLNDAASLLDAGPNLGWP